MPPKGKYNEKGQMTDQGMLEYLEDMIGSNRFIEAISSLETKVEELNGDRTMKLSNVKIVEKEKDELEGDKDEAEALLIHQNDITAKQNALFQLYHRESEQNTTEASEKKDAAKTQFEAKKTELKDSEKKLGELEEEHSAELKSYKTLQKAADEVRGEFAAFERKDVQLREKQKHSKATMKKLSKTVAKDKATVDEIRSEIESVTDDVARYTAEIEAMQEQVVGAEEKLEDILEAGKGERAELKLELDAKQAELEPYTAAVNEAQSQVNILREELDLLLKNKRTLEAQLVEATANLDEARTTGGRMEEEIAMLQKREAAAKKELANSEKVLSKISDEEPELSKKVQSKRAHVEERKAEGGQVGARARLKSILLSPLSLFRFGFWENVGAPARGCCWCGGRVARPSSHVRCCDLALLCIQPHIVFELDPSNAAQP
jgi:structural maintenance of chromosome 4